MEIVIEIRIEIGIEIRIEIEIEVLVGGQVEVEIVIEIRIEIGINENRNKNRGVSCVGRGSFRTYVYVNVHGIVFWNIQVRESFRCCMLCAIISFKCDVLG